jgi:hypothetical protein
LTSINFNSFSIIFDFLPIQPSRQDERSHYAVGGNSTKFGIVAYSFLLVKTSYKTQLCYLAL